MVSYPAINLVDIIIDEVALEGLDGITLEALRTRLAYRFHDELPVSHSFMTQVWSICKEVKQFAFYQLETPRQPLVIFDRYEFVDPDLGTILEPEVIPTDIYPHSPVQDFATGDRGSCSTYYSRKEVTNVVRHLSFDEVTEKYNARLVIVASQSVREHALIGDNVCPTLELNVVQYCFLERVGRSRYHGEVTQGKISLSALKEDPKSLFYHRKYLLRHRLITKQLHHQKSGGHGCTGSLLHLPRFYVERKPKVIYLAEEIINILKAKENGVVEYNEIRKKLQIENSIKKLFKTSFFQKVVKTDLKVPYRTLYPNADAKESQQRGNMSKEKMIRVAQLIDPNVDIAELWGKDEIHDDDTPTDLVISHHKYCVPYLKQTNTIIEQSKRDGTSQAALAKAMGLTKLQSRTFVRNMVKANIIATYMNDMGRQRLTTYVSKKFEKNSEMSKQFKKEMHKIKEFTKDIRNETNVDVEKEANEKQDESVSLTAEEANVDVNVTNVKDNLQIQNNAPSDVPFVPNPNVKQKFYSVNRILCKYRLIKRPNRYKCTSQNVLESSKPATNESDKAVLSSLSPKLLSNNPEAATLYNNIKTKLVSHGLDRGKKSSTETFGFIDDVKNLETNQFSSITYRLLKRANMIIECVKEYQVIDDMGKLMKMINEEEGKEGYDVKIDKKSLIRLLQKLAKDNLVKSKKLTLSANGKEKTLTFICDPSIDTDHTVIKSAVEQAKLRFCLMGMQEAKGSSKNNSDKSGARNSLSELECYNKGDKAIPKKSEISLLPRRYDSKAGRRYGYIPKFLRMQELHVLLYYLVYDHPGKQTISKKEQIQILRNNGYEISNELAEEMSPIYNIEVGWRMFIPPLPKHTGWPHGWALLCDVLLRIPLSIFTKLHNVTSVVPGLDEYLSHPIKKHFLVKDIPPHIRKVLLLTRKYIFNIHQAVTRLCYIGLVQFGPQKLKEKDQVFLFLNRRTELLDTTSSSPSYHKIEDKEYPVQRYVFHDIQVVEKYWHDMWKICINTSLGGRLVVQGKDILLEDLMKKSELIRAAAVRAPDEAHKFDTGVVPGDRQGAAGIDSAFFAHLPRNWNWSTNRLNARPRSDQKNMGRERDAYLSKVKVGPVKFTEYIGLKKISGPISLNASELRKKRQTNKATEQNAKPKKNDVLVSSGKTVKQKSFVRRVMPRKISCRRRVKYDETDYHALQRMHKLRVDWEPHEDNILLVCKVAMMYLCPKHRKQIVSFTAVRDVLRSHSYSSHNKTSRACQRRLMYMLRKPQTVNSVALGVEEVKENFFISKRFGGIVDRIKAECQNSNEYEKQTTEVFKELVAYIARKFYDISEVGSKEPISVPKTIQEFNIFYKVVHPKKRFNSKGFTSDVRNINDIHAVTINSVIHSSMCCRKNRSSWTYQLFKVYQQYSEVLLRNAMSKIRSDQLVAVKKNHLYANKKYMNYMPMSSSQYQLSTNYVYKFQTKWPYDIFRESYDVLIKLIKWYHENHIENSTSAPDGIELCPVTGGIIAMIQDYITQGHVDFDIEIPDQIIMLDPRLREKDETYQRIAQRYQDIMASLDYADLKNWDTSFETYVNMRKDNSERKKTSYYRSRQTRSRSSVWLTKDDKDFAADQLSVAGKSSEQQVADLDDLDFDSETQNDQDLLTNDDSRIDDDDDDDVIKFEVGAKMPTKKSNNELAPKTENEQSSCALPNNVKSSKRTISESSCEDSVPKKPKLECDFESSDGTSLRTNDLPLNESSFDPAECSSQEEMCPQEATVCSGTKSESQQTGTTTDVQRVANSAKFQEQTFTRVSDIIKSSRRVSTYLNPHSKTEDTTDARKRHTRIALLRMREELNDLSMTDSHHAHEYFVVNMFKILYSLHSSTPGNTDTFKGYTVSTDMMPLTLKVANEFVQKVRKFVVFPKDVVPYSDFKKTVIVGSSFNWDKVDAVYKFVREKKEIGATVQELRDKFECAFEKELYSIVSFLRENYLFLRSGVTAVRYIHHRYAEPWLINSYKIYRLEREAMLPMPKGSVYELGQESAENADTEMSTIKDDDKDSVAPLDHSSPKDSPTRTLIDKDEASVNETELNLNMNDNESQSCVNRAFSSDSEEDHASCTKRRMQRKRTSLLPQKEIYRAAQQLDFTTAEEIRVVMRPWVRIDGVLNRRVLDRMLGSVLSYCLTHPGATLTKIQNRYVPALQPFHTRELVEMLIELKCLEKRIFQKPHVTILSTPTVITPKEDDDWVSEEEIFIEPAMCATLRFSIFLSTKSYAADFMS